MHAPLGYECPFCIVGKSVESPSVRSRQADVVFREANFFGLIPTRQWPNNLGHLLLIPYSHIENLYEFPIDLSQDLMRLTKIVAQAFKLQYKCDGLTTRQHNEPSGGQDVWHYHLHVFPRYDGDNLYKEDPIEICEEQRATQARLLREHFQSPPN